jgi:hypothetical protein
MSVGRQKRRLPAIAICPSILPLLVLLSASPVAAITPDNPGAADVRFTVNSSTGAKPISPYIYGSNFLGTGTPSAPYTLDRLGGNRWSAYNWETNASNAGKDYRYQNDNYLVNNQSNTPPGQAVLPSLQAAATNHRGLIVTVPMAGYASADALGTQIEANQFAPSSRFKIVEAKKSTIYPGSSLSTSPDKTDNYVFTDEFVNWVESKKQPGQQVFYDLDNEPGLWGETLPGNFSSSNWQSSSQPGRTHPEIHPYAPTYQELRDKTIANAGAIKDVNPDAIVFGGVGYGWNDFTSLQGAQDQNNHTIAPHPGGNDPHGEMLYYDYLLQQTAAAEAQQGRTLMDVIDMHWYPEAQGGGVRITENNNSASVVAARVQAPRSLWDPTYTETSWITQFSTLGPIKLLPRLQRDIDDFKPGTKMAITEYNYGGTNHISGGIAEADVLGIYGKQGVFAATFWDLYGSSNSQYVTGAFKMYLNYNGAGGKFGDTSVDASTDSISKSAVYASTDTSDPSKMVLVAINRMSTVQSAALAVTSDNRFDYAEVYQLTSSSANPQHLANVPIDLVNAFIYSMPAYSVSTLVLRSAQPGDFNMDGQVNGADLAVWKANTGLASGAFFRQGDADRDGDVDGADFLAWQTAARAAAATGAQTAIPEPAAGVLFAVAALMATCRARTRRRRVL